MFHASATQWSFLIGCVLFTVDGILYVTACVALPSKACVLHSSLYTSGSLLFLLGTVRWMADARTH